MRPKLGDFLGFRVHYEVSIIWYEVIRTNQHSFSIKRISTNNSHTSMTYDSLDWYIEKNLVVLAQNEKEKLFYDLKVK